MSVDNDKGKGEVPLKTGNEVVIKPLAQLVNDDDEVIGHKDRLEIDHRTEIYRVAALWITNPDGDVLLAQRAVNKRLDAGKWGPAIARTIEDDETYESNIYKEAEEEIGLTDVKFQEGPKLRIREPRNLFVQYYTALLDRPIDSFVIQEEEVAALKWFPRAELVRRLQEQPDEFTYGVHEVLEILK